MPTPLTITASTSSVIPGEGSFLAVEGATPGTFATIGGNLSIDGPERTNPEVDTTNLLSTAKTNRPGKIPDSGEVSFSIQFDPADVTHLVLEAMSAAATTHNFAIVFNTGAVGSRPARVFLAWVKSFKLTGMEDESNLTAEVTLRITGLVTTNTA